MLKEMVRALVAVIPAGEQHPVEFGLSLYLHGVGSRRTGHSVEAYGAVGYGEVGVASHLGAPDAEVLAEESCGLFAGGDDGAALGYAFQQRVHVGRLHHLQVFVSGCVARSADGGGSVVDAYSLFVEHRHDVGLAECLVLLVNKVVFVFVEQQPPNAPHVVGEVGIEEIHAPPFPCGRKTAQHEQLCAFGQKRLQRVALNRQIVQCTVVNG